jgi:peroxiredoxin
MAFIGAGLIVLGFVLVGLITNNRNNTNYSVVPMVVDFPAPEISLNDLNGNMISISDYQDKIVMINNWATWCPPCEGEMPTLSKYFSDHIDHGFMLVGIEAGDPVDEVANFVKKYDIKFPVLLDPNNKSLAVFRNDTLPSSYVIDRNGKVIFAWTGPINRAMLDKYITPLLEQ